MQNPRIPICSILDVYVYARVYKSCTILNLCGYVCLCLCLYLCQGGCQCLCLCVYCVSGMSETFDTNLDVFIQVYKCVYLYACVRV